MQTRRNSGGEGRPAPTILVVGVTGFVGSSLAARLHHDGWDVVGVSRAAPPSSLPVHHVRLDIACATDPSAWCDVLAGVDSVVYCAGALQEAPGESLQSVHQRGPAALFRACAEAGVRRVVHLSAVGVDRATPTAFSRTKYAGDMALMESDLDWVILRPSVVIGRAAFGGAALLRGLAALPVLPVPAGAGDLQVVHLDDLVDTIMFFLRADAPARVVLDIVGPRAWPFAELVALFRRWLGWRRPALQVTLPRWLAAGAFGLGNLAGRLGWQSAIGSTAGTEIMRGAVGDSARWTSLTGIRPRDIEQVLAAEPASVQERWFARLYLLRPWIFGIAALFWISTGVIALGPGWDEGIRLMNEGGVFGWPAVATVVAGALCDIAVGVAIAWRRTARYGLIAAFLVTFAYAIIGTVLVPRLWSDPMGPMLKVLPILVVHLAALGIVEER